MYSPYEQENPCPVKGHDHQLKVHSMHTQQGTDERAWTLECPGGRYRFFVVAKVGNLIRMTRPRHGWKDER